MNTKVVIRLYLLVYVLVVVNAWIGPVQLTNRVADFMFMLCFLLLPFIRLHFLGKMSVYDSIHEWKRSRTIRGFFVLCLIFWTFSLLISLFGVESHVRSFEYSGVVFHVQHLNFGATDDGSTQLIRDRPLFPLLKFSQVVYQVPHLRDFEVVPLNEYEFQVSPTGGKRTEPIVVRVK